MSLARRSKQATNDLLPSKPRIAGRNDTKLLYVGAIILLSIIGIAVAVRYRNVRSTGVTKVDAIKVQQQSRPDSAQKHTVEHGSLPSHLQGALKELGDRLEKPSHERLVMAGVINRPDQKATNPIQVITELSGAVRVVEEDGQRTRTTIWDGTQAKHSEGALSAKDLALLETLSYDSSDHYFLGQTNGLGTREIGFRYREDDGSTKDYTGPYYDIYQVRDQIRIGSTPREQLKFYYFNSDTLLLERVRYVDQQHGTPVKVEIQIGNWHKAQNQLVPGSISRLEDGQTVFNLEFRQTTVSATAQDGIFSQF